MKQAPGIERIEYKVLGSETIHSIPAVKGKSSIKASTETVKGTDITKVKLSFRVVENNDNSVFIAEFLKNYRQYLLFRVFLHSGKSSVIGSEEFRPVVDLEQTPGEKAGDFVGYIVEVTWSHPLFM